MKPVTDPGVLSQLEGSAPKPVSDPALLSQLEGSAPTAPVTAGASPRSTIPLTDSGGDMAFTSGNMWKAVANTAGAPVDIASSAINLGRAGYGTVKGAMGGTPTELLGPQVGGSDWIQNLMRRGGLITPAADPQSTAGRYLSSAIQFGVGAGIPGAAAGRIGGRSVMNAPRAITGGAASGVASELAGDVAGEEAKPLGAMIPFGGAAKTPGAGERATAERRSENFGKAKEMGIPIPPRAMKEDPVQQRLQDQVNQELRQPPGAPITPESIKAYNKAHWKGYEDVIKHPSMAGGLKPSPAFQTEITKIGDEIMKARTELPETFKTVQPVIDLLGEYGYAATPVAGMKVPPRQRPIPADLAMRAVQKLRSDASSNLSASDKPEQLQLGMTQRRIAKALEDLIESNIKDPTVMQSFREHRTAIAQGHDVLASLDPVTRQISAARMSKLQSEGQPLSGALRDISDVGGAFPGAMRTPESSDMLTKKMSPHAALYPQNWLVHMLHSATDPVTLTRPWQATMVDPRAKSTLEQQRLQAAIAAALSSQQQGRIPPPPQ